MSEKKVFHILTLIKALSAGEEICIKEFSDRLGVSDRSIDRYLKDIEEFFGQGSVTKVKRGCYAALSEELFKNILLAEGEHREEIEKLYDLINLVNPGVVDVLPEGFKKVLKKVQSDLPKIYKIKENPFEEFCETGLLGKLKFAIKHGRYCDMVYDNGLVKEIYAETKPFKIVFAEGNWYLAVIVQDESVNNGFRFLRIGFIKELNVKSGTFYKVMDAEDFIESFQTLFSDYKVPRFEVFVEASGEVARFFKRKKHLKSQQIVEEKENGNLLIRYETNNKIEIFMLLKKWLPELKLIEPAWLKEEFETMVQSYFQ